MRNRDFLNERAGALGGEFAHDLMGIQRKNETESHFILNR